MASVDQFEITIVGKGGHAAMPHLAIDPVLVAAHVVTALQSARLAAPRSVRGPGVVSVTQIAAGHPFNVIPEQAELRGTVRTFGGRFFEDAPRLVDRRRRAAIAAAFGAEAEVQCAGSPAARQRRSDDGPDEGVAGDIVGAAHVKTGVAHDGRRGHLPLPRSGCRAASPSSDRRDADRGSSSRTTAPRFDIDEERLGIGAELLERGPRCGTLALNRTSLAPSPPPTSQSAAHQPVHWFPWGDAAFARAREEDKPILLDIGAVWCHWCHVMDGESYEDPDLAPRA